MKRTLRLFFAAILLGCFNITHAQMGINTKSPHPSAALDIKSPDNNTGLLIPKINLLSVTDKATINGGNPATGLMVFNTNTALNGTAGFVFWDGSAWKKLATSSDVSGAEPWFSTATDAGATLNTENIYSNGWVGIGYTRPSAAPNEKLRVNGTISTVNSYYADYVFEDYFKGFSNIKSDYKFKTLDDVDAYIKQNKHLPGITPINELEKTSEGYAFNVSQLSIQLLEKTEELYLHAIEQKKELETKNNEIQTLNDRIEKLEKLFAEKR